MNNEETRVNQFQIITAKIESFLEKIELLSILLSMLRVYPLETISQRDHYNQSEFLFASD